MFASGARCVSLSSTRGVRLVTGGADSKPTLGELPRHGYGSSAVGIAKDGTQPRKGVELRESGVGSAL